MNDTAIGVHVSVWIDHWSWSGGRSSRSYCGASARAATSWSCVASDRITSALVLENLAEQASMTLLQATAAVASWSCTWVTSSDFSAAGWAVSARSSDFSTAGWASATSSDFSAAGWASATTRIASTSGTQDHNHFQRRSLGQQQLHMGRMLEQRFPLRMLDLVHSHFRMEQPFQLRTMDQQRWYRSRS